MSVLVHSFVLSAAFCTGPLLALSQATPVAGEITLVVTPPHANAVEIIEASGGRVIGPTVSPFGALAIADAPDFLTELNANGAWLVRDGSLIARLCGVSK